MAERRMFAKTIVLSDAFLDMPLTARCLYFTLGMFADDDGFVNSPKGIMRQCGASEDDMKLLMAKRFILAFDSGVIVIKHWRINNYLRNDRYQETKYLEEKAQLITEDNGAYTFGIPNNGIPSIGKVSIDKDSIDKDIDASEKEKPKKHKYGDYGHVHLTDDELAKLKERFPGDYERLINNLDKGIELKGYKYKNHYLAILKWAEKDAPAKKQEPKAAAPTSADMAHMADVLARIKGGG